MANFKALSLNLSDMTLVQLSGKFQASFPIFTYLESGTTGVIPNEYEAPWTAVIRFLSLFKKSSNKEKSKSS